jgi:hypothetical protein
VGGTRGDWGGGHLPPSLYVKKGPAGVLKRTTNEQRQKMGGEFKKFPDIPFSVTFELCTVINLLKFSVIFS